MARPSIYSDKFITTICEKIANGQILRSIGNKKDIPNTSTIMHWLNDELEFQTQYTRARELQVAKIKLDAIK